MKKFFLRYSHWFALLIIGFSFITMFINFKVAPPDIVAIIMGAIGLLSIGYLTFVVERRVKKQKQQK